MGKEDLPVKVLVCGGRDYYDFLTQGEAEDFIHSCLMSLPEPPDKSRVIFISGMARGADHIPVRMVEEDREWGGLEKYYAEWQKYGNRAGPLRNIKMLEEGRPDMVIAFPTPKSSGTHHMINISRKAGVPVFVYGD